MDVIVVLPNTTSETSGALNSMGPGGTNHYDNLSLLHNNLQVFITNTKYQAHLFNVDTLIKSN